MITTLKVYVKAEILYRQTHVVTTLTMTLLAGNLGTALSYKVVSSNLCGHPQWGAADAEIKVPSGENTELKRSPLKPGIGQSIAIHATLTARDFFLAYFYPSGPFTCIFSKTSPDFLLRWLWLTPVPV